VARTDNIGAFQGGSAHENSMTRAQGAVKPHLRVVYVEDSRTDAELAARHLAKAGLRLEVLRVETEQDFVSALKENPPDLILSDFSLPQFSGLMALDLAVVHAPATPFIYVSGTIGEERAIEALRRGATDYVLKGNMTRLPSAVERALRGAELQAAKAEAERRQREQGERLQRLTRTYRMLSSMSSAILRFADRGELLDEVCRIGIQQGGYARVSISLVDPESHVLDPRACAGGNANGCAETGPTVDFDTDRQLAERVLHSMQPHVVNDIRRVGHTGTPQGALAERGYCAMAALPLLSHGTAVGAIILFSGQTDVFDAAEVGVLQELAANLEFALKYHEKDRAVEFLSHYDSLTGLAKRPLFCQRLAQALTADAATGSGRSVVVFDVQKLGAINDTSGRHVGDALIEAIARRLEQIFGDTDCMSHFGGGTFALMLEGVGNADDTGRLLQNAAAQVFVESFAIHGLELRPAVRSGVSFYPHDAEGADELVQNAEAALKAAREDNEKYMLYGLVTQRPTSRSMALEGRLAQALERREFLLHYQPKVNIASGRVTGLEALLRWQDSEDGLVPPGIFVPLLERSGAIVDVGEWVFIQAVRDLEQWMKAGRRGIRVAVNVSPLQLRRHDFVERVLGAITSTATLAAIDIEITESMLMQDLELSIRKLAQLREAGVGAAIDDFGTGYSSLRMLARLPVDTLKIDRSFIQGMTETAGGLTLVSTVVSLARAFGMRTVAEGVETPEQFQNLKDCRCDEAQGFLLARPMTAGEVPNLIQRLGLADGG
jgi:diguanylate cyclase (GGDEF)-like protein